MVPISCGSFACNNRSANSKPVRTFASANATAFSFISLTFEYDARIVESAFSRTFCDSVIYFDTASFALSSVVCAISRIFSACSLIFSLIALSLGFRCNQSYPATTIDRLTSVCDRPFPNRLGHGFDDFLQFLPKLVDQNPGVFRVVDGNDDKVYAATLEGLFKCRDDPVRAFDP